MAKASDVMRDASILLNDRTHVHWPLPEMRGWINAALREIVVHKPSATARNRVIPLVAGTRQTLPTNGIALIRVIRNVADLITIPPIGRGAITSVSREVMDSQLADWHDASVHTAAKYAVHAIYDPQDPKVFYVYPPNDGNGRAEVVSTANPDPVPAAVGSTGNSLASYNVELAIDDIYANSVLDYVLYRAWMKDANFAGNAERAMTSFQAFAAAIGLKSNAEIAHSPNTTHMAGAVAASPQ